MTPVVDGDAERLVVQGAADVGGVDERRIDHQRIARPVRVDLEGVRGRAEKLEAPADRHALAVDLLVDGRRALAELAEGRPDDERSVLPDAEPLDAPVGHADPRGVAARPDDELLLQMAPVTVESEVDAVPDPAIDHLSVGAHSRPPAGGVVPEIVVVGAWEEPSRFDRRAVVAAEE